MDRVHRQGSGEWESLWAGLHDWSAQVALAGAGTAEQELTIDWQRHCDRLRHEQPRPHQDVSRGPAPRPQRTAAQ